MSYLYPRRRMTEIQQLRLDASKHRLLIAAIRFAGRWAFGHADDDGHDLFCAAHEFAHIVEAIDSKLWKTLVSDDCASVKGGKK